jgi:hypothetical protein
LLKLRTGVQGVPTRAVAASQYLLLVLQTNYRTGGALCQGCWTHEEIINEAQQQSVFHFSKNQNGLVRAAYFSTLNHFILV